MGWDRQEKVDLVERKRDQRRNYKQCSAHFLAFLPSKFPAFTSSFIKKREKKLEKSRKGSQITKKGIYIFLHPVVCSGIICIKCYEHHSCWCYLLEKVIWGGVREVLKILKMKNAFIERVTCKQMGGVDLTKGGYWHNIEGPKILVVAVGGVRIFQKTI